MATFGAAATLVWWNIAHESAFAPKVVALGPNLVIAEVTRLFDVYRDRADTLYKLIGALLGLTTFYSLVIGVAGYQAAQFYEKRFGAELANLKS